MRFINSYGQDKVIFGTDFPVLDFERTMGEIRDLNLKPEALARVLRENAIEVYGLDSSIGQ